MGSFYASISSKSKVSQASPISEQSDNEHRKIPSPPAYKAPTVETLKSQINLLKATDKSIEMNQYDIRTRKFY